MRRVKFASIVYPSQGRALLPGTTSPHEMYCGKVTRLVVATTEPNAPPVEITVSVKDGKECMRVRVRSHDE